MRIEVEFTIWQGQHRFVTGQLADGILSKTGPERELMLDWIAKLHSVADEDVVQLAVVEWNDDDDPDEPGYGTMEFWQRGVDGWRGDADPPPGWADIR